LSSPAWETEVFVLRGEDRAALRQKVQALATYLECGSGVALKDLAFTLNTALPPGGSRLAVVAGTSADLRTRLTRAVERLADCACKQIKDSVGIYYFSEPLSPQGRLAFLFPGEGAQYLNMLRDLCEAFPEVRDCFAGADRMAGALGQPERSLSRVLFVSPQEQDRAEKELRQLDHAMFSVLVADWAINRLLGRLGVRPDAVAGHSMGELAALVAADCLEMDDSLLPRVLATLDALQEQEDRGSGGEAVLLAVGAGRQALSEVLAKAGPGVYLAMDNCPHQSVVVGLPRPMAVVEAELQQRQVLCERLPFRRPYHTPLFEPFLPDLDRMFDTTTFRAPKIPVYSCTTSQLFSADPVEVRRLAVAHWAAPAEFTRMIENMYADGVRLFVEAGPRGNLSAFVEDILRGRPFAALPANVQRRSGINQLHHLVGQLAAHHVPLQLEALYAGRESRVVPWDAPATASRRGVVLAQYLEVMGQFLDTQREVMEQFLSRNHTRLACGAEPTREPRVVTGPLLGDILRLEPGKEAVMRRRLDLAEDLFAAEHTIGGRTVSKVDPHQHGLPVMPMTFSLEMMAELASLLLPGQVVVGFEGVRLLRWLPFDDEDPATVEVTARVLPAENGTAKRRVAVEVRDLGSSARPGDSRWVAVQGTVLLEDHYPAAPVAGEFSLAQERPCRISLEVLYRNLFHGPQLQGVLSTTRIGVEGVEGEVQVLPRSGLFRSHPDPDLLTDPVLIDVAMHPLVSWHLEQPNQAGRILLPIELGSLSLFGPRPAVGTRFRSRGRTDDFSARHYAHTVEVVGSDGQLWCRLTGMKYWRMYVPFCEVNFHGPKDEYFLSGEWSAALPAGGARPPACCMRLDAPPDLQQHVLRSAAARVTLTPAELQQFRRLKSPEPKRSEWLFGRIAAKDAVRMLWSQRHGERLFPADIEIETDAHGRPSARRRGATAGEALPAVSLAHTDGLAIGLAAFGSPVGVDIERIKPRGDGFEEIAFDDAERRLLDGFGPARDEGIARFWCAKEAVGKALGRGLIEGPRSLAVRTADVAAGKMGVVLGPALAEAFPELREVLLTAWTLREKDVVVATTFCERETA
jgi:malonyl CoA-acyl carrier protein transacylase/phosphopantetheinyl transferase